MNNAYVVQTSVKTKHWPWMVGITVLLVTLFFPPPLPVDATWPFLAILSGGGSFWQALHSISIPPHTLRYYLAHSFGDMFFNHFLPFCGFPALWSLVSVGMWWRVVNRAQRPTIRGGILAVFLAGIVAFLISIVLIWLVVTVQLSRQSPSAYAYLTYIVDGAIVIAQAILYLPFVLLAGAIIAKFQARALASE